MQTTLIILKPDTVQRGLMGKIIHRFERKGLRIVGAKMMMVSRELASKHYAEHVGKSFYDGLLDFVTSSPVLVLGVAGNNVVAAARKLIGATHGGKAEPGTIRGDFGMSGSFNMIHGSDSPESAQRELELWFGPGELVMYEQTAAQWVHSPSDF